MKNFEQLISVVPSSPDHRIDWNIIELGIMSPFVERMKKTQQNPEFHGEGDVWQHTKMECECLVKDDRFESLERRKQQELFLAALFHDVGKIYTTKLENGNWTSPYHSLRGANIIREMLWREYGLCGTKAMQNFRETVCLLIRYHMAASHILESENTERKLVRIASNGELAADFELNMLLILSMADNNGRLFNEKLQKEENLLIVREIAEELNCLERSKQFSDPFTQYSYLSGKQLYAGSSLYNDTEFEAVLMCGLPGTGKDTFIKENYREHYVISLDDIREEFGISPAGDQKEVVRIANERAKKCLRQKQSFVWNATNITPDIRSRLVSLFIDYHAYVKIVFLETGFEENLKRNKEREKIVPQNVIEKMLSRLVPPERFEAHEVEWICL